MDLVEEHRSVEELVRLFVRQAKDWAEANAERIGIAYESAGGWELWLEVELYVWLRQRVPSLAVSRQSHGYAEGAQRADLLLGDRVVVELKAETREETARAFADRVEKDRAKVDRVDEKQLDIDWSYEEGDAASEESDASDGSGGGATPAVIVAFAVSTAGTRAVSGLGDFVTMPAGTLTILWELTG
ncbi:hypothetical protein [Streptomyces marincola]|uniref:hypothetical protein n=1 Tax=Streptomyces marincola TaxID=2878388 RepID=UPI001CF478E7|nr:hypothetical protein [Streptomyces marincola]UCM87135.1 hypothetical protein LC193_03805 [Streptomyces marincola]